jgi:polysaccharide export outer membrane protein
MGGNVPSFKFARGPRRPLGSAAPRPSAFALVAALALSSAGCASAGQYVWYGEMPPAERSAMASDYIIGVGDVVNIRVYEQEGLSGDVKVRRDGKTALPLLGEIVVAGKRPLELSSEIETKLKQFVVSPRVTVNVTASQPVYISAIGEVQKVGSLTLDPPARMVEAMAQCGGPNDFADKSKIFVLRQFPTYKRIRFTWNAILHNDDGAASFPLRTGDVIVVE